MFSTGRSEGRSFQTEVSKTKTKISEINEGRNKSGMFEELYEDCLSHLKIRRLVKAFSVKSDYSVKKYNCYLYLTWANSERE